jgi:hypothetical protein
MNWSPVRLLHTDEANAERGVAAPPSVVAHDYPRRDFVVRRLLAIVDVLAIVAALAIALRYGDQYGVVDTPPRLEWLLPILPAWVVLFKVYGLYDRDIKRISHTTVDDLPHILHALIIGTLLMWTYYAFVAPLPTKLSFRELVIPSGRCSSATTPASGC